MHGIEWQNRYKNITYNHLNSNANKGQDLDNQEAATMVYIIKNRV